MSERRRRGVRRAVGSIAGVVHEASGEWGRLYRVDEGALDESGEPGAGRSGRASSGRRRPAKGGGDMAVLPHELDF